jgi:hypothetical protein
LVISSSVGSVGMWGYKATIFVYSASLCAMLFSAGIELILGDIAISEPLEESYLVMAI